MKARILAILGVLTLAMGFGIASGGAAFASTPNQYCTQFDACLNAWNGGPYVNAYHENVINNNFYVFKNSQGYWNIEYVGDGNYKNQCIGDYGNGSGDARAGLYGDCASGVIAYGANFRLATCPDGLGYAFEDVHWTDGWLTPNSNSAGSPFYLNSATVTCYYDLGAG
jgi:hypothetical protein